MNNLTPERLHELQQLATSFGAAGDFPDIESVERHFADSPFSSPVISDHDSFSVCHPETGLYIHYDWWCNQIQFNCIHTVDSDGHFDSIVDVN